MRRARRLLTLCLLAAAYCAPAFGATNWTGKGKTDKASDRMNWSKGRVPGKNDYVVFGAFSAKDCAWDINGSIYYFTLEKTYKGSVRLQTSALAVSKNVNVEGGMLDLQNGSLAVGRRLYVGARGSFDLSNGTLSVGPTGILVDAGGTFLSTGDSQARIKSAKSNKYYRFVVGRGNVTLSNPAGTEVKGSQGITLYSKAKVSQADFVKVKQIKPGKSAVKVFRVKGEELELKGWTFDKTVKTRTAKPTARFENPEPPPQVPAVGAAGADGDMKIGAEQVTAAREPGAGDTSSAVVSPGALPADEEPQEAPFTGLEEYETESAKSNFLPYLAVQFNGGQHFLGQDKGNLSGNLNALASVVIKHEKLGPKWTIVPVLSSQYQGTKQVTDLVGGGTLFQERMAHSLAVRGVYQLSPRWKLKPGLGYKWEFLKETRDESWGDGLFDYRRPGFSLEGEYAYKDPFSYRIGYDFYHIGFVNFTSLESIIKDSVGNSMARELAGRSVLDSNNHSFLFGGTVQGPWRSYAEGTLITTFRLFPDQHVVNRVGDYRNSTRRDFCNQLSLGWRIPRELSASWKAVGGLRLAAGYNKSNQNSYDAQRLTFLKDYYDSTSIRAGMDLSLYRKLPASRAGGSDERPLELNLSATVGRVGYLGRVPQDATGLYQGGRIRQDEAVLGLGISYPIAPHFVWTSQFGYGRQTSNQDFERLYKYNFTTTNYKIGFGYEY